MADIKELKSQLKAEWAKLKKGSGATNEEKVVAKKTINRLEKEANFTVTDFAASDAAFQAKRAENNGQASKVAFVRIEKFTYLDNDEIEASKNKIRRLFELKNLAEQIAHDEFPQYENGASVGQVLGILEQ